MAWDGYEKHGNKIEIIKKVLAANAAKLVKIRQYHALMFAFTRFEGFLDFCQASKTLPWTCKLSAQIKI